MLSIENIRPVRRHNVFDLVEQAGFDVADWIESSNNPRGHKANPKYCYEWAFVVPNQVAILNLWHSAMRVKRGLIVQANNFREDADYNRTINLKLTWAKRAQRMDEALQTALRDNLPVRVIINDGIRRSRNDPMLRPSQVTARELDSEPWTITEYEWASGRHELTRGVLSQACVDQFDLDLAAKADLKRRDRTVSAIVRDPAVRRRVLLRSKGHCELCGRRGFEMVGGALYLETHHIVPLAEGGADADVNVVALCPDDHRRAHFALEQESIAENLTAFVRKGHRASLG